MEELCRDIEQIKARMKAQEQEMASVTRIISVMDQQIRGHEDILQKNGIGELRVCVGDLKTLLYGKKEVNVPGLIADFKREMEKTEQLVKERDRLKWILVGVALASVGQTGLLISIANKVFSGIP